MYFRQVRKVSRAQYIAIPKEIARELGIQPYDHVAIFVDDKKRIIVRKVADEEFQKLLEGELSTIN